MSAPTSLSDLVADSAARWPTAPAVVADGTTLTYAQLDDLATRLAGRLRGFPARRGGQLVGVAMRKGWRQIVAVLAVLRAGAAYLPIDPDLPAARMRAIAELAECRLVLTEPAAAAPVAWPAGVTTWVVDDLIDDGGDAAGPMVAVGRDDLAYVLFTSGSTGEPKGVMIEHGGVIDTVLEINSRFGAGPGDAVIGLSALSFDLSVYDIFGALAAGATLVLPDPDALRDPAHWIRLMHRHAVSVWHTVPALMNMLVSHLDETGGGQDGVPPDALRLVILSGDWIPLDLPDRVRAHFPAATVVSMGGSTETTINSLIYVVDRVDPGWRSIPYGRPLPAEGCFVLGERLRPVSAGEPGDLYITGTGLARGYWRDPERTAESFPRHPGTGERMYRTGDRALVRPDGLIEFLGRRDRQVKIRGFRIELGEIEAALACAAGVAEAVVVATGPRTALDRLTAFVRPAPRATPAPDDLRSGLAERLPAYMVPAEVHVLAEFPLTGNGKVDRAELARRAGAAPDSTANEPPRPGLEQRIADALGDLLDRPVTSRTASFIQLGVNSLVSAQFATRLRRALALDVPIALPLTHPSVARLAEALAELPAAGEAAAGLALVPRPSAAGQRLPVSFGQEQVWFLDRLAGGNRAYHFQCDVRFRGELRPELVRRALTEIVRRHEILRTTFHDSLDGPVQVVHDPAEVPLPVEDLRHVPLAHREEALHRGLRREFARSFDLSTGPLIVWKVFRVADDDWVITETEHHLVHDGWSVAVFWREVSELYSAWARGRQPELPGLPVQFADFARWQRARYTPRRRERLLAYWRDHLVGAQPFDLVVSGPRSARQTFGGAALRVALPDELYARLRQFARDTGSSLFTIMFTAFTLLMHYYSGARDLTVGTWMANRGARETEHLIGMLVNMVALRTRVAEADTFATLLDQVRGTVLAALAHQDAPFDDVVRALAPPRDPSRNPLVQTCFSFHDSPVPDFHWPGADGRLTEHNNGSAKFDINVVVIPRAEQLRLAGLPGRDERLVLMWEFNTDLIPREVAELMVGHFQQLLASAVAVPGRPVDRLSIRTDADRAAVAALDQPVPTVDPAADVVALVDRQVALRPDAVAVDAVDGRLTYRELRHRAGALSRMLVREGVGVGDRVAVCVDRGWALPVALLGTLLAGAAYVPVDHRQPAVRTDLVLADADVRAVITRADLADRFAGRPTVLADAVATDAGDGAQVPAAQVPATGLAYVLHTSGSTGTPKGVRVPRGALAGLLAAMRQLITPSERDTLLAVTTVTFDIAALELFLPLVTGARLVIASAEAAANGEALAGLLAAHDITMLQATPLTWRMLVEAEWRPDRPFTALCGGEVMPADLAAQLADRVDACWNLYGPTETTIWSTAYRVRGDERVVPIGRPLANTAVRVLDANREPVPVGLPGELYIGGTGVAVGYTSAALTAERFIELPAVGDGPRRFYRTGDLVRLRVDGELEFLGRTDRQVKLHGYRIEPEEIEQVLRAHAGVRDCAVELRGTPERLVGYVVLAGPVPMDELARHAGALLPRYMVPATFLVLPELPRSINGKLDHAALPEPDSVAVASTRGSAAHPPANPVEERLSLIWSEILGRAEVGVEDDFFELGGHSLLALRLVSRIRHQFGRSIELETVFDHPTVRELAGVLDTALGAVS